MSNDELEIALSSFLRKAVRPDDIAAARYITIPVGLTDLEGVAWAILESFKDCPKTKDYHTKHDKI